MLTSFMLHGFVDVILGGILRVLRVCSIAFSWFHWQVGQISLATWASLDFAGLALTLKMNDCSASRSAPSIQLPKADLPIFDLDASRTVTPGVQAKNVEWLRTST